MIQFSVGLGNQHFNTTNATGSFSVMAGIPSYEAVLVNDTNLNDAVWMNYDGIVHLNLGPTDGVYQVSLGLMGFNTNDAPVWIGTDVYLDRVAPAIIITSPTNGTVSVPYIQLQGCSPEQLAGITYDVSNAVGLVTNQAGQLLGGSFLDTNTWQYTTDYFQCFDLPLTNGVNTITIHATDVAGNVTVTNFSYILDYGTAINPVIALTWPTNGMQICQSTFTWRGTVDDATVSVMATITDTNGDTNIITGEVERTGVWWVENLPLAEGTNQLMLTVSNAAGLLSTTNILVVKSDLTLAVSSIDGDLWEPTVNVSGVASDFTAAVYVNGVAATTDGDGNWNATGVPVSAGGVASFDLMAVPAGGGGPDANTTNMDKAAEIRLESGEWDQQIDAKNIGNGELCSSRTTHWDWSETNGGYGMNNLYRTDFQTCTNLCEWGILPNGDIPVEHDFGMASSDPGDNDYDYYLYAIIQGVENFDEDCYFHSPPVSGWHNGTSQESGAVTAHNSDPNVNAIVKVKRSETVHITLYTGGKAMSGRKNLFALTASAVEEVAQDTINSGIPSIVDGAAIPFTSITVDRQQLGTDGIAWKVYQDGSTPDVTPQVHKPMYHFSVDKQKYKLSIAANNITLDPEVVTNGANYFISQYISFQQAFPATLPQVPVSFTNLWALSGDYVNDSVQPYANGSINYFQNQGKLTNTDTSAWWWKASTSGSQINISVTDGIAFSNGQSVSITASGLINMFKPNASIVPTVMGEFPQWTNTLDVQTTTSHQP